MTDTEVCNMFKVQGWTWEEEEDEEERLSYLNMEYIIDNKKDAYAKYYEMIENEKEEEEHDEIRIDWADENGDDEGIECWERGE